MGQPVKLSDALVLDARVAGAVAERSIAGQIEFWARLGRVLEPLLTGAAAMALRNRGDAAPLSELLSTVDSPAGRQRLADYLRTTPFPHYEAAPGRPGLLVRIESDGKRTTGRFVRGEFAAEATEELLPMPSFQAEFAQAQREIAAGETTPASQLRRQE